MVLGSKGSMILQVAHPKNMVSHVKLKKSEIPKLDKNRKGCWNKGGIAFPYKQNNWYFMVLHIK